MIYALKHARLINNGNTEVKELATHFKYKYLDSGAMYRAVTLFFLKNKVDINDISQVSDSLEKISIDFVIKSGIQKTFLNGKCVEDIIRKENILKKVKKPKAIIAKTMKGKGFSFSENNSQIQVSIIIKIIPPIAITPSCISWSIISGRR